MDEVNPPSVVVGEIAGAFGVQGWVKVRSYTDPPDNILIYKPWAVQNSAGKATLKVTAGRRQGNMLVARLEGIETRDQAAELKGLEISVPRTAFPKTQPGQYYWADLIGLEVVTPAGMHLGQVRGLLETGANDVLEVFGNQEHLIPFVQGEFIKEVDLVQRRLVADWDPDF